MASSVIGQLRVILGLDTAQFEKGLDDAQRQLVRHGRGMEKWGERMAGIGQTISVGITLPLLAIGGTALGMAANFESAMNRVEAATGATGAQLDKLRDKAKAIGKDKAFTATAAEAADVMEMLAKNGLSAEQIMGGATEAALRLAAATGGQMAPAADLVTDIMKQFGKTTADLPSIVDKVTGSTLVSKFGFDDYRMALGQAGGAAAGLGQDFDDMNVAIAATDALFASGSDAGTSYKTFLLSLSGNSKEAKDMIAAMGLQFFDAAGKLRPLSEIAGELDAKLGGLSDKARAQVMKTIFGTDAMRTAIGLMQQGSAGIEKIRVEIDKASAQTQMEARMKGWAGGITQVKKAFEAAAIALGDSGFLSGLTAVLQAVAAAVMAFASLPEPILITIGVIAGLTAAVGPMVFITGKAISMWGGLVVMLSGRAIPALLGTATATTAAGTAASGAAVRFGVLRGAMTFLTGPWGIAIGLISAAIWGAAAASKGAADSLAKQATATDVAAKASDTMNAILASDPSKGVAQDARTLADARIRAAKAAYQQAAAEIALRRAQAQKQWGLAEAGLREVQKTRYERAPGSRRMQQVQYTEVEKIPRLARVRGGEPNQPQSKAKAAARAELDRLNEEARAWEASLARAVKTANELAGSGGAVPGVGGIGTDTGGSDSKGKGSGGGRTGPTKEELADRREELKLQAQLDAAQVRGDLATVQRIQDQLHLKRQIADYEDAGLTKVEARKAAESDLNAVVAARREWAAREIADQQRSVDIDIARLTGDERRAEELERQRELQDRIRFFEEQLVHIADERLRKEQAITLAKAQQADVDAARAAMRDKWVKEDALRREIELMKLRGDSEERIRMKERELEIQRRIAELRASAGMTEDAARDQAEAEADATEMARRQGEWREVFRGGLRAALDGNLGDFVRNWWKERVAKALENALNSVSDLLFNLFSKAMGAAASGGGGGGGILGTIGSALGSIFGGGSSGGVTKKNPLGLPLFEGGKLPGFKTGGSFRVGGMSGVDRNLVSFRATRGEIVDIRRPGQDRGPGNQIVMHNDFRGADAGAVAGIRAKLDQLDRNLEGRAINAYVDAKDRRMVP